MKTACKAKICFIKRSSASFLAYGQAHAHPVPAFVRQEFSTCLRCGVLEFGFARIYCHECKFERLLPFSCKKRGFCGSCLARRMSETAVRLVESVIPEIPTRQWVLSLPAPLRFLVAYDAKSLNVVVKIFIQTIFSHLKHKANRPKSKLIPGAVTYIQRFGSALNLNLPLHSQFSDGVFEKLPAACSNFTEHLLLR